MGNKTMDTIRKVKWKGWYDESKRKILILTFNKNDLNLLSNILIGKEVLVDDDVGFNCYDVKHNDLVFKYWFLTSSNRHLWRHHYMGAQAVIIVFSCKNQEDAEFKRKECMSILVDSNLRSLPFIILFENFKYELLDCIEKLRNDVNNKSTKVKEKDINYLFVSLKNEIGNISLAIDWLANVMKPISF